MMVHAYFEERGRKFLWLLNLIIFCAVNVHAQYPYNGNFESTSIPVSVSGWNNSRYDELSLCGTGWKRVTCATPDYFHEDWNNTTQSVDVPPNTFGTQPDPISGNKSYAGIFIQRTNYLGSMVQYREYITSQLKVIENGLPVPKALQPGSTYRVSFLVSLAELNGEPDYGISQIGAYFSDSDISSVPSPACTTNMGPLPYDPQVHSTHLNTDQLGTYTQQIANNQWRKVEGIYTVPSNENPKTYITIGNFQEDFPSDEIKPPGNYNNTQIITYYYIDEVQIEEIEDPCNCDQDFSLSLTPLYRNSNGDCCYSVKLNFNSQQSCLLYGYQYNLDGNLVSGHYSPLEEPIETNNVQPVTICIPSGSNPHIVTVKIWTGNPLDNLDEREPECTKSIAIPLCSPDLDCDCDDFGISYSPNLMMQPDGRTCAPVTISQNAGSTCSIYSIEVEDVGSSTTLPTITNNGNPITLPFNTMLCGTCIEGPFGNFLYFKIKLKDQNGNIICERDLTIPCGGGISTPEICDCDDFGVTVSPNLMMQPNGQTCAIVTFSNTLGSTCTVSSIEIDDLVGQVSLAPITNNGNPISLPFNTLLCGTCVSGLGGDFMHFRVRFKDQNGNVICEKIITIKCNASGGGPIGPRIGASGETNDSDENHSTISPENIALTINPNPSDNEINISFELMQTSDVKVELYNTAGSLVALMKKGNMTKGSQAIKHSISEYPSGTYHIRISVNGAIYSTPLIISH